MVNASKMLANQWYKTPSGRVIKFVQKDGDKVVAVQKDGVKVKMAGSTPLEPLAAQSKPVAQKREESDAYRQMRKDYEAAQRRKDGEYGDRESNLWSLEWGDNHGRILPTSADATDSRDVPFYKPIVVHYDVGTSEEGGTKKSIRCTGKKCRVCARKEAEVLKVNAKFPRGSEAGKKAWAAVQQKWGAKKRFMFAVAVKDEAGEYSVKVLPAAQTIGDELLSFFFDDQWGDFTDVETGREINIKKIRKLKNKPDSKLCDYKVSPVPETSVFEEWEALKDQLPNLDEMADQLFPALTPEQQDALMSGKFDDDDSSEADGEADEGGGEADEGGGEESSDPSEPIPAEEAQVDQWYMLGSGVKAMCVENPTSKGNVKFRTEDDTEKFYKPETMVTPVSAPETSEAGGGEETAEEPEAEGAEDDKPGCFGDPKDYDPKDSTCRGCAYFKPCGQTPAVVKLRKTGGGSVKDNLRRSAQ